MIEKIKSVVRGVMYEIAKLLDLITNGFIRPWHLTLLSLAGHIIVMLAIMDGQFVDAAVLLFGFGLLDALDGAVARFQGNDSDLGMLLDSSTDRIKETLIFAGLAYYFAAIANPEAALYSVLGLGLSFAVSYIKSKGEVALLNKPEAKSANEINREFEDGVFGYEIRMTVLVVAFALSEPLIGVVLVTAGSLFTFIIRFGAIADRLK